MEYIEFIQDKDKNLKIKNLIEQTIYRLSGIKNIFNSYNEIILKYKFINIEIEEHLKIADSNTIYALENKLKNFTINIHSLDKNLLDLINITNFPTTEIEIEIKNHINFCFNRMNIDGINLAIDKCISLITKLGSEKIRIQREKEAKKLEQERHERERLAKLENDRLQKIENDRKEKERKERLERERIEQERLAKIERERLERERIEREKKEKQELYIKIAKYIAIAIGLGLALWIIIAYIIPFIVAFWWLILLIGGGIAYFAFKNK